MGSPAYLTFEDSTIGGNAVITNFHTCWLGFIRNTVSEQRKSPRQCHRRP